jgi:5-methylcytosine-specific restriction protein B
LRDSATVAGLARVFRANVLPLLQEYFFEDFERVRWVLNDHRKPENLQFLTAPETGIDRLFGDGANLNSRPVRWVVNEQAFQLPEAYSAILSAEHP